MSTTLYLHAASNALSGTFPTGTQSATTPTKTATGATTLRTMNGTAGTLQASNAVTTNASTSAQTAFMAMFCSAPLQGAQTVGGGTMTVGLASKESSTTAAYWLNSLDRIPFIKCFCQILT